MAIATYADLQASIASWLHRSDLTTIIPDFITLAEARMNGDLNARSMQVRTTLTCVPGPTVAARYVALPTDMVEMKRLVLMTDPAQVLEYRDPDGIIDDNIFLLSSGRPSQFTIVGGNIELSPAPDSAYSLELVYLQRLPALSTVNTTNWALTQNPNVYLFGALVASVLFTQDEARLPMWEAKYKQAVDTINNIDWYSGSGMTVKAT